MPCDWPHTARAGTAAMPWQPSALPPPPSCSCLLLFPSHPSANSHLPSLLCPLRKPTGGTSTRAEARSHPSYMATGHARRLARRRQDLVSSAFACPSIPSSPSTHAETLPYVSSDFFPRPARAAAVAAQVRPGGLLGRLLRALRSHYPCLHAHARSRHPAPSRV